MQTPSSKCTRTGRSLLPAAPNHPLTPNSTILPLHLCAFKDPNQATNFTPPLQVHCTFWHLARVPIPNKEVLEHISVNGSELWKLAGLYSFPDTLFSLYSGELWFASKLNKLYCKWCHWKGEKPFLVTYLLLRPPTALQGGPKEYKRTIVAEAETLSEGKNCRLFLL